MQKFRILYFRHSVLESTQEVCARDVLEAIEKASGMPAEVRAEVWSGDKRVAEIGSSLA